ANVLQATQGANTTRYVHAQRGIHAQKDASGNWEWMLQDGLGSVRGVVDSSLNPLESRLYEPYGVPFGTSGTSQTSYGFTGEMTDVNALLYLRARYYAPSLGVFTGVDPLETPNRYGYVSGNPINYTDPLGLQGPTCIPFPEGGEICIPSGEDLGNFLKALGGILAGLGILSLTTATTSTGDEFPCTYGGPNAIGEFAPFGYSELSALGSVSVYTGDPLGDLRCHLRYYNGIEYDALFEKLSQVPYSVGFKMQPTLAGFPSFAYLEGYSGVIYVPQPTAGLQGTRADRIASFVEEIVHSAQYNNSIPGGSCTMSQFDAELQAKTLKETWLITSGIDTSKFKYQANEIAAFAGSNFAQELLNRLLDRGSPDPRNRPAFPYYDPATASLDFTKCACPSGGGHDIAVPFVPNSPTAVNISDLLSCSLAI
ncbi:MAG: RHS repeat-associated core domain-containing protein, partial [Chloroflexota bacterium]